MRISILTYGTHGDVQPLLALAVGLQQAGHQVRLAGPQRFAGFVGQRGVAFAPLPGEPEEMSARINNTRRNVPGAVLSTAQYLYSVAAPVLRAAFAACADADFIVHMFFFTSVAHSFARARRIPDLSVQFLPLFAPTSAFPMPALVSIPPGRLSYLAHWTAMQMFRFGMAAGLRLLRLSSPDVVDFSPAWPFAGPPAQRTPLVFAFSPSVVPVPREWQQPHIHVNGYFFLDTPPDYQPPPALARFLASSPPPICVTFGSMVNRESERVGAVVRAALEQTGQRAVVLTGWGRVPPEQQSGNLLYLDAAPHDWVLPRCQAVIHHGGAGTTGASLRAGIPTIIVPHAIDQPFWGQRVAAIGAGPPPISLEKLSPATLAAALAVADDAAMRRRAAEIGRLISAENGVGATVRLIEEHAARYRERG